MEGYHKPVLLREVIEALVVKENRWYLDCTLGDGGHSLEILRLGGNVLGIDVDPQALERVKKRLQAAGLRLRGRSDSRSYSGQDFRLVQGNFRDLKSILQNQTETKGLKFKGCLFDLGVSSLQLERPERGFSFSREGPLDMRMDPALSVSALDLIKGLNKGELYELFAKLGQEKLAKSLAAALVSARKVGNGEKGVGISSTRQFTSLVEGVYRKHGIHRQRIHPATRVFLALRMAVNDELNALKEGLYQAVDLIEKNGHIVVISFHSLEDRIVKDTFRQWQNDGLGETTIRKPITPAEEEVRINLRSRSAKMRVFRVN